MAHACAERKLLYMSQGIDFVELVLNGSMSADEALSSAMSEASEHGGTVSDELFNELLKTEKLSDQAIASWKEYNGDSSDADLLAADAEYPEDGELVEELLLHLKQVLTQRLHLKWL